MTVKVYGFHECFCYVYIWLKYTVEIRQILARCLFILSHQTRVRESCSFYFLDWYLCLRFYRVCIVQYKIRENVEHFHNIRNRQASLSSQRFSKFALVLFIWICLNVRVRVQAHTNLHVVAKPKISVTVVNFELQAQSKDTLNTIFNACICIIYTLCYSTFSSYTCTTVFQLLTTRSILFIDYDFAAPLKLNMLVMWSCKRYSFYGNVR